MLLILDRSLKLVLQNVYSRGQRGLSLFGKNEIRLTVISSLR